MVKIEKQVVKRKIEGQLAIEYMLLLAVVVVTVLLMLLPNGILTRGIEDSIDSSVTALEGMANGISYNLE